MSAAPSLPSLDKREWAQETLKQLREQYHSLPLEDRLTVRRTLREMAGDDEHE